MSRVEQVPPAFCPEIGIWPCQYCVRFPMVKSEKVVADFNDHVNASGVLGDSPDPKEVRDALKVLMGQKFKERLQSDYPLPTAAAIKFNPSIPMLEAAGGGTLHDLKKARKACIAIYKCIKCSALYVLPEDFKAAGRALDYPVGAGGMTPEAIRKLCVRAMQNAYQGLGMEKAEVYCFKNFVVMIDLMLEIEYDYKVIDSEKGDYLSVFDVGALMP